MLDQLSYIKKKNFRLITFIVITTFLYQNVVLANPGFIDHLEKNKNQSGIDKLAAESAFEAETHGGPIGNFRDAEEERIEDVRAEEMEIEGTQYLRYYSEADPEKNLALVEILKQADSDELDLKEAINTMASKVEEHEDELSKGMYRNFEVFIEQIRKGKRKIKVIAESNIHARGYADRDTIYLTESLLHEPISLFHEIGHSIVAFSRDSIPASRMAHTLFRGVGKDVRKAYGDLPNREEYTEVDVLNEADALIKANALIIALSLEMHRPITKEEASLIRSNFRKRIKRKGMKGEAVLYGLQDIVFGREANDVFTERERFSKRERFLKDKADGKVVVLEEIHQRTGNRVAYVNAVEIELEGISYLKFYNTAGRAEAFPLIKIEEDVSGKADIKIALSTVISYLDTVREIYTPFMDPRMAKYITQVLSKKRICIIENNKSGIYGFADADSLYVTRDTIESPIRLFSLLARQFLLFNKKDMLSASVDDIVYTINEKIRQSGYYDLLKQIGDQYILYEEPFAVTEMGVVFRAFEMVKFGGFQKRAIKIAKETDNEEETEKFRNVLRKEIVILTEIEGFLKKKGEKPLFATCLDSGEIDGKPYLVMPFIEGRTLGDIMDSGEELTPAQCKYIAIGILGALKQIHDAGYVMVDFKPNNIMVSFDKKWGFPSVTLIDFGAARKPGKITEGDNIPVTPRWMPPGYLKDGKVVPAADVFSAALIIFVLLFGRIFRANSVLAKSKDKPQLLKKHLPDFLAEVLGRALTYEPDKNYPVLSDILKKIDAIPEKDWQLKTKQVEKERGPRPILTSV